jgi:hypothetical protein
MIFSFMIYNSAFFDMTQNCVFLRENETRLQAVPDGHGPLVEVSVWSESFHKIRPKSRPFLAELTCKVFTEYYPWVVPNLMVNYVTGNGMYTVNVYARKVTILIAPKVSLIALLSIPNILQQYFRYRALPSSRLQQNKLIFWARNNSS